MTTLDFSLHPAQIKIFNSKKRFRAVSAGRRFGKSYLSCIELLIHALEDENWCGIDVRTKDVFYIAPTFQQAKDIMWRLIKDLGGPIIESTYENTGVVKLVNGRKIHLKGSDRPDTLRGVGLSFVVLDEYASMRPEVWEQIIRPTLADVRGRALFIGTPAGKNHFYDLFLIEHEDWETFHFHSKDNPFIPGDEIEQARSTMSHEIFRQEFEASFESFGSKIFSDDMIKLGNEPEDGDWYIAVDPAGFKDLATTKIVHEKRLDETAIAIVKVGIEGWYVADIIHGRWGIRETSIRILKAAKDYRPICVGIEKGALKNALMPYMDDQMRRLGVYPRIADLTHGGQKKVDRITWALQGRFQHGRIILKDGGYVADLKNQMLDFPNPTVHDDLLDALSYIDQLSSVVYGHELIVDDWRPTDDVSGF